MREQIRVMILTVIFFVIGIVDIDNNKSIMNFKNSNISVLLNKKKMSQCENFLIKHNISKDKNVK